MDFPTWVIFALLSPAFWAIVVVLDSHCVSQVFERPWMGGIASGLTMLAVLPLLAIGLIFTGVSPMSPQALALAALCGSVFMISQLIYFHALETTESGIVAAYWNLTPLLLPIISYLVFGEVLSGAQYAGALILVMSSVGFCLLDGIESRWSSFAFMFVAAWLQITYFMLQKRLFEICPVYQAFLVITLCMALTGLLPLIVPGYRKVFRSNWPQVRPAVPLLLAIEVANLLALATSQYAVHYGTPTLVSAVEASLPLYTFLLSMILYAVASRFGDAAARDRLPIKLLLSGTMVLGVWLVL